LSKEKGGNNGGFLVTGGEKQSEKRGTHKTGDSREARG